MLHNQLDPLLNNSNHLDINNKNLPNFETHSSLKYDLNVSKQSLTKLRWKLLSTAIRKRFNIEPSLGSIRQFSSFNLFETKTICSDNQGTWFQFVFKNKKTTISIKVRILTIQVPIREILNGFDNTGNICIWPSEEVLAYYCIKNSQLFSNKVVCELGGGMTCLSGLIVSLISHPKQLILTDGNQRCVENIIDIVNANMTKFESIEVNCRLLRWNEEINDDLKSSVDVILNADCLYFESCRQALILTILKLLKVPGIAILLAPNRGSSLQKFCDLAKNWFQVEKIINYDSNIWKIHQNFFNSLNPDIYSTDLHYPVMIILRKI